MKKNNLEPLHNYMAIMLDASIRWIGWLENYPGWKEWNHTRLKRTLYAEFKSETDADSPAFVFSEVIERQHAVVFQYLCLLQTVTALKECEYYFRRFPFRNLPVTHSDHITNICEMYFGRFYEFRERLKKYLNALIVAAPKKNVDVGGFIKLFDKEFDGELRARHSVHHHERFEDQAIDRVYLAHVVSAGQPDNGWKAERQMAYRRLTKEWVSRVRKRASKVDEFMEAAAQLTIESCDFLDNPVGL
ncbi:hypothetical protein ACTJJ2_19050 [Pseudomonas sp. 22447]|uniref:hypothetical protein n=1 Tax=Pseudomonas sp. 22447 TaxID=3453919 RepID=UPI003F8452F8